MISAIKKRFMSKQHRHESRVLPRIGRCCLAPAEGTVLLHTGRIQDNRESSEHPSWFPSMGDTDGSTSISTDDNTAPY